ncbi:hypothetical protein IMSHALPRED_010423 [Imshaugia aleurites]|uniref:Aminoglycoside phosphotransferase domain-containing protein n=1 Tax=Imshaugia aleurites TaxID=172621 RepID=A0A8H3IZT2_9LECA|nr:hypothetical protein IMSHALPRED_010423 [Imshaugia aleurites]
MEPKRWIVGSAGNYRGVYITESNVLVKYGPHVFPSREAATMQYVRQKCPGIPVPVVHDTWTADDDIGYISMASMPGKDLEKVWPGMDSFEKETVMKDYKAVLQQLRSLDPLTVMLIQIGAIDGGPAVDHRPSDRRSGGPLIHPESREYHSNFYIETLKASMKDNHKWHFTHGDMGPHNILVENGRISAVLDWELAGWYPEYWEYVKMIQYLPFECWDFRSYARRLWDVGEKEVFYDIEYMIDQTLDSQVGHGERIIKQPR